MTDTLKLLSNLKDRNPFSDDPTLRSIAHGVVADAPVNVDQAKRVGTDVLTSMIGRHVQEYTFRKSNQVVTLGVKSSI